MPIYKGSEKIKDIAITGQNTNCLTYIPQDVKLELDPLNATIVGSPTINNGIVSGFSTSNYIRTPNVNFTSNWEVCVKFNTGTSTGAWLVGGGGTLNRLLVGYNNLKFKLQLSSDNNASSIGSALGTYTLLANTNYWVKVTFNGSKYVLSYSLDGKTFTTDITITSSKALYADGNPLSLGVNQFTTGVNGILTDGSIDLTQCYIKLNGSTWWKGGTGNLTLKAGSKVYMPNGFEDDGVTPKFDVVTIESDVSLSKGTGDEQVMFFTSGKGNTLFRYTKSFIYSGLSKPSVSTQYAAWYDTSVNKIKVTVDTGATWGEQTWSLPLAWGSTTASSIVSVVQTFNGFGYIGSTIFSLPGVKGLVASGRNADGTLKSVEATTNRVMLFTRTDTRTETYFDFSINGLFSLSAQIATKQTYYDSVKNLFFHNINDVGGLWVPAGTFTCTTGTITSFKIHSVKSPLKTHYIDKVYKGSTLVYQGAYTPDEVVFEKSTAGTYSVNFEKAGLYEITVVGGGGAAAMRGVYDDKGYGWTGGSGGAFVGTFVLERGTRTVVVGKANNNTTAQSGNTQTLNPTDTKTYGSSVSGVVSVGGGGSGHYSSNYVGAAGAAATLTITPTTTTVNKAGKAGNYGSGGKGGGAGATINGGASVYNGYGKGQGCVVSEYANKRSWINGTAGYVKIVYKGRRN